MFLDARALVAILADRPEAAALERRLAEADTPPLASPLVRVEAALLLARLAGGPCPAPGLVAQARGIVDDLLADLGAEDVAIDAATAAAALDAAARFGRLTGHPAALDLPDCFAYACAKARGAPLL